MRPCKYQIGTFPVHYKATSKRVVFTQIRKKMVPCQTCECDPIAEDQAAAKKKDLNGAENAFTKIDSKFKKEGRDNG